MKKRTKMIWKILIPIFCLLVVFQIASSFLCMSIEKDYNNSITLTEEHKELIDIYGRVSPDREYPEYVVNHVHFWVYNSMKFRMKNDYAKLEGNCEGQAMFCAAAMNYLFKEYGFTNCYAKPVTGQVYFCGINLTKLLTYVVPAKYKNFVRNHTIVEVTYVDGRKGYCDPSLPVRYCNVVRK